VDARELLSGDATFVADTSAWWRAVALPEDLAELLKAAILVDRMLITPIVRAEILYSARTSNEYVSLEAELDALRILRNDRAVADAATSAMRETRGPKRRLPPRAADRRVDRRRGCRAWRTRCPALRRTLRSAR
jgi:predicted nucleic acid-binding protein